MKNFVFISFYILTSTAIADDYYYPKTDIFSVSTGIYYDNPGKINSFITGKIQSEILTDHVYYLGLSYKINHNPIISNKPYFLLYSIDLKYPITRKTNNVFYNTELQTYSLSAEVSVFESYIKTVTVHPILGMSISKTDLIIPFKFDEISGDYFPSNYSQKLEKLSASFNIGGGCDLRMKVRESEQETKNLIISFEAKYSVCLDALNFYNSNWMNGPTEADLIPDYILPGLSVELKLGIENQRK